MVWIAVYLILKCHILITEQLITFALYNLCVHPEYVKPLRAEITRAANDELNSQNEDMPLLDSFIKETARLNPPTISKVPFERCKYISHRLFTDADLLLRSSRHAAQNPITLYLLRWHSRSLRQLGLCPPTGDDARPGKLL